MICGNCGRELKRNWEYCPFCGNEKKDSHCSGFGFSSEDDIFDQIEKQFKDFNSLVNEHKFEFKPINLGNFGKGISISISSDAGKEPKIRINGVDGIGNAGKIKQKKRKLNWNVFKKAGKREEANFKLKRLASGLRYEIDVPGVKSVDDVEIRKLEDSIEINAYAGNKIYFKAIPVDFEIKRYYIEKDKLILELVE